MTSLPPPTGDIYADTAALNNYRATLMYGMSGGVYPKPEQMAELLGALTDLSLRYAEESEDVWKNKGLAKLDREDEEIDLMQAAMMEGSGVTQAKEKAKRMNRQKRTEEIEKDAYLRKRREMLDVVDKNFDLCRSLYSRLNK